MNHQRYLRHTTLKDFGEEAQSKLGAAKVLVVGLGGLGIPVAQYLNAMGVGTLGLVEHDVVELTNLQRQVLYTEADIGSSKLQKALKQLNAQNAETKIIPFDCFMQKHNALAIIEPFDVVVDASDNFATRYLVNDACVILKKPLVYGALHGFEGHVSVFNFHDGPTYRCLFPHMPKAQEVPNCDENGVLGVIPAIVGTLQALEAVKVVTGIGEVVSGKLLIFNGLNTKMTQIGFSAVAENKLRTTLEETYAPQICNTVNEIAPNEFVNRYRTQNLQVIDVRTEKEFNSGHLKKASNLPLDHLLQDQSAIDFDLPVYLICQSGIRSLKALNVLQKIRASAQLYSVSGGMDKIEEHVDAN